MKNDFVKNKNNVVKPKNNGSFINTIAVWLIIIVSVCSVLGCVFSALNYFKSDIKTVKADYELDYDLDFSYTSDYFVVRSIYSDIDVVDLHFRDMFSDCPLLPVQSELSSISGVFSFDYAYNSFAFKIADGGLNNNIQQFDFTVYGHNSAGSQLYLLDGVDTTSTTFIQLGTGGNDYNYETFVFRQSDSQNISVRISGIFDDFGNRNSILCYHEMASYFNSLAYYTSYKFNFRVIKVESKVFYVNYQLYPNANIVSLTFTDTEDYVFTLYYLTWISAYERNTFVENNTFTYYTDYYYNISNNQNVNQAYNNGYSAGSQAGYNSGKNDGYNLGFDEGYETGVIRGFNDAYNTEYQPTFFNLIASVVDAPVQAFAGLLNFDLLGVNLFSFFTGLLTLGLIIFIIRLILGGG